MKFRVWDKLSERYILPDKKTYQGHFCISLNGEFWNMHNGSGGDEYVVQMGTGVKDSNGKEIYDGDIVKLLINGNSETFTGFIGYRDGSFFIIGYNSIQRFSLESQVDYDAGDDDYVSWAPCVEVIGNIFEEARDFQGEK